MKAVEEAIGRKENLAICAPSGFGKTIAVLTAALTSQSPRVLWFTRTHREAERVIEEAGLLVSKKLPLTAIQLQSRAHLCPVCQGLTPEEASLLCREKRDTCTLYSNFLSNFQPPPTILLTSSKVYSYYLQQNICPYYAQVALSNAVQVLAASFPFLINPQARRMLSFSLDAIIVIDEAHGLPEAVVAHHNLEVGERSLAQALEEAEGLNVWRGLIEFMHEFSNYIVKAREEKVVKVPEVVKKLQELSDYPLYVVAEPLLYWGVSIEECWLWKVKGPGARYIT